MRMFRFALLLLFVVALLGCGAKKPPRVATGEDIFTIQGATAVRQGPCALLTARLEGAVERLDSVALRVEDMTLSCPTCPFQPRERYVYELDDPRLNLTNGRLELSYCGLEGGREYRFQLEGVNELRGVTPGISRVMAPGTADEKTP